MTQNKPDEPQFFVSRRGRQVGLHEVDLKGIDVDHDTPTVEPLPVNDTKPRPAKKPRSKAPRDQKQRWSRRKTIITSAVILALVALPVGAAELVAAEYRRGTASARHDLGSLVSSEVAPTQKQSSLSADKLRTIAGDVDAIAARMCRGGMLDNIASLYPRAQAAHDECKAVQRNYTALAGSLFELESQARYLERVESLIKPVTTPITDEYAVISAQQTSWRSAADGIKKLSPPTTMASAHIELSARTAAIAAAWTALVAANGDQDADGFTGSEETLNTEYEALRATSDLLIEVINTTQAKVTAAYELVK